MMNKLLSNFVTRYSLMIVTLAVLIAAESVLSAGISIDAGLTPAEGRWMMRTQYRQMESENESSGARMTMRMHPLVVAHGLRSNLTLMARVGFMRREMKMMGNSVTGSGFGDLLILAKYRLVRKNTADYTIGIAPTLGVEIPTGEEGYSSESWDGHIGCFLSGRAGRWGIDMNLKYVWNGIALTDQTDIDPGDEIIIESAIDRRFGLGTTGEYSLAPVLETSYNRVTSDQQDGMILSNSGESVLWFSPGLVFTRSSLILEGLVQFPVWQDQTGMQMERSTGFIIGLRLMN